MVTASLGQALDRAVGLFSPGWEARRLQARAAVGLLRQRSQYAAAKTGTQMHGHWSPADPGINTVIGNSRASLTARTRQLVRDMPHLAAAVARLEQYTVGTGLRYQARVVDGSGKLAKNLNQKLEDAWAFWADEADVARRLHLNELMALAKRQDVELGEFFVWKRQSRATGRYLPFALLALETDVLSDLGARALPGNELSQGVEYDPRTGRIAAYHVTDYDRWSRTQRVPAEEVVHGFHTLRPNQLRGVTPFAPGLLLAHNLRDYLDAEVSAAQMAARYLSFITSSDPSGTMAALGAQDDSDLDRKTEDIGVALQQYLLPNEDVTIASHNRPGTSFTPFVKFVLETLAITTGVPYELLAGDYTQHNYSSQRGARNDFQHAVNVLRARHVRQFCQPIFYEFLDWAVLTGKLDLPNYFTNPWPYRRSIWIGDGWFAIDPLREGRADIEAVKSQLKSPQEVIVARGRDPEQLLDEQQQWQEMLEDRDLAPEPVSAATQTNPAAVAPGTGNGDGDRGRVRRIK